MLINRDVHYSNDITLSMLIEMCFFSITERLDERDSNKDFIRNYYSESYSLPVGTDFYNRNWEVKGESAEIKNLIRNISHVNSIPINSRGKVWKWSNYKQVIELAGYLN